jgi:hypothetical protein
MIIISGDRMSKVISWLKDIFCNIPTFEITPEKEDEMIERIVEKVTKYDMEIPAIFLGSGFRSTSTVLSQMVLLPMTPYLEAFGIHGEDYVALFSNKDNVRRLMERLDEEKIAKEIEKEEEKKRAKEKSKDLQSEDDTVPEFKDVHSD